jgi:predicted RNA-binding Zn-ribbon protein involved in translation (DUF1610 family)
MTDAVIEDPGSVLSIFTCPECGEDLRLETREGIGHEYAAVICPDECWGVALRIAGELELDTDADTRDPAGWCHTCQDQIVEPEDAVAVGEEDLPETVSSDLAHVGECAETYREEHRRLGQLRGDGA